MKSTDYVGYVHICAYRLRWDGGTKLESLLGEGLGRLGNRDVNESIELHCVLVWQLGGGLSTIFAEGGHPEVSGVGVGRWRAGLVVVDGMDGVDGCWRAEARRKSSK